MRVGEVHSWGHSREQSVRLPTPALVGKRQTERKRVSKILGVLVRLGKAKEGTAEQAKESGAWDESVAILKNQDRHRREGAVWLAEAWGTYRWCVSGRERSSASSLGGSGETRT